MRRHDVLLLSIRYGHSLIVEESIAFLFNYYFCCVVEEDSSRIVTQLVA
jgi:hypothetical protein